MGRRIPCAGAVVRDGADRILVIRRGHEPSAGLWSIPGGRVEPGESVAEAAQREVLEETGLQVEIGQLLGRVLLLAGDDEYDVSDFAAVVDGPSEPQAGDDAADVRWVTHEELAGLDYSPGLLETLEEWRVWG